MFRNRPVSVALIGLFVWVTGCRSYSHIEVGEVADHGHIRVTLTDGERDHLYNPVVQADSIRGQWDSHYSDPITVIPLDQVSTLESVHSDPFQTFALIFGIAAVVVGIGALMCCGDLNTLEGLGED